MKYLKFQMEKHLFLFKKPPKETRGSEITSIKPTNLMKIFSTSLVNIYTKSHKHL